MTSAKHRKNHLQNLCNYVILFLSPRRVDSNCQGLRYLTQGSASKIGMPSSVSASGGTASSGWSRSQQDKPANALVSHWVIASRQYSLRDFAANVHVQSPQCSIDWMQRGRVARSGSDSHGAKIYNLRSSCKHLKLEKLNTDYATLCLLKFFLSDFWLPVLPSHCFLFCYPCTRTASLGRSSPNCVVLMTSWTCSPHLKELFRVGPQILPGVFPTFTWQLFHLAPDTHHTKTVAKFSKPKQRSEERQHQQS